MDNENLNLSFWKNAADIVEIKPNDPNTMGIAFGVNIRVHVKELFSSVWNTIKSVLKTKQAILSPDPLSIMDISADIFAAITASMSAFWETMQPLKYLSCAVISASPNGIKKEQFKEEFEKLINLDPDSLAKMPWYLGINKKRIEKAKNAYKQITDVQDIIDALSEEKRIKINGDLIEFIQIHFTWGFTGKNEGI
jgi:hypothetical protein